MNEVYLLIGGNMGDRKAYLIRAKKAIERDCGTIVKQSAVYETEAWGITYQPSFYNQILVIESQFPARKALNEILKIEAEMGRKRTVKNSARIIDIDILFFNDDIVNEENLLIPHPEIPNRRFVLMPLNEIAPDMLHPGLKKTMKELLAESKDHLKAFPVILSL